MVNWKSNVFPGILGRTCDRPCEPACRRVRVEDEPVAICRLKRVAADFKDDITARLPKPAQKKNGKRIALVGGGPASLTVARDLAPHGYQVTVFDADKKAGGMIRTQIPKFRLPDSVIDEETGYILGLGVDFRAGKRVDSLKKLLGEGWDAVFVGSGAPRGRDLDLPGRAEAAANIHIGIDWLSSVSFGHVDKIGKRVIVLGGGNTAMDCCRSSRRLGGEHVTVVVRSGFKEMKASPWEKEDAMHEDIPILDFHVPKEFTHVSGRLTGIVFAKVAAQYDAKGRRSLVPTGEPDVHIECDDVLVAVGQENAFPWIERDIGLEFDKWDMPKVDPATMQSTNPRVFFGGDAAFGPKNIIWAVAHGHDIGLEFDKWDMPKVDPATMQSTNPRVFFGGDAAFGPKNIIWAVAHGHDAAISIDLLCQGKDLGQRPPPMVNLSSQKMGIHEWSYANDISNDLRFKVSHAPIEKTLKDVKLEVELGFDIKQAFLEAERCLNCDVQTVFDTPKCIECDACVDICPMDCITFTANDEESALRRHLTAPALLHSQDLYISSTLKTGRIMAKDEDLC